jgi:hypothetical protein
VDVVKIDAEQRRVYGWGYVAKNADGTQVVDASGDFVDTDEAVTALEDAFHRYVLDSREADDGHETFGVAKLVEAVFMSPDKAATMGLAAEVPTGFWVGYEFPTDEVGEAAWQKVKARDSLAFSIVGDGWREDAEIDS